MIEFDINNTEDKSKKSKTQLLFENLSQLSTDLIELLGNRTLNFIKNNYPDDYKKYCDLKNQIFLLLIEHIKTTKTKFNFDTIIDFPPCKQFWFEIKYIVDSETSMFLSAMCIKNLDAKQKEELYKNAFTYIYIDREDNMYISEHLNLSKDIIKTVEKIFSICEDIIIFRTYSKNRFKSIISDYIGLGEEDIILLWELFSSHKDILNKITVFNKLNALELKIDNISNYLDKISNSNNELATQFMKFVDVFSKWSFDEKCI